MFEQLKKAAEKKHDNEFKQKLVFIKLIYEQ